MAYTTRIHGDFQPVMNYDKPDYDPSATVTSAVTVQPQGPKLEYFTIVLADLATDADVLANCINAIQQLATIYMYEVTNTGTDTIAVGVYPVGAWATGTLDTATGGTTTASATFTN